MDGSDELERELGKLALQPDYLVALGLFHGAWASFDLTTDYAICQFLKVTPKQAHLITSGMMFGRKARLLADLIGRSRHPKKALILATFNKARGSNKRDIFAHGWVWSSKSTVRFLERTGGGEYKAIEHSFTLEEFRDHVAKFMTESRDFYDALGATYEELNAFARAALSLNRKSKTSPGRPTSKAK